MKQRWIVLLSSLVVCVALAASGCAQGMPPTPPTRDAGQDAFVSIDAARPVTPDAPFVTMVDAATCEPACSADEQCCSGGCVGTDDNPNHCGRCGNRCPMGMVCAEGVCGGPTCTPACDTGETCTGGTCRCGAGAACTGTQTCCGTACVDTQTSATSCGSCGRACASGEACMAGRCVSTAPCGGSCPSGQMCCSGTCTRVDTVANCGACGRTCGASQECCGGMTCVSTQTDRNNCGGCGSACGMRGDACSMGSCTCGGAAACLISCTFGMCFPA